MKNKTPKPVFKENMSMAKIQGVRDIGVIIDNGIEKAPDMDHVES